MIRIPVHLGDDLTKFVRFEHKYYLQTGENVSNAVAAKELGVTEQKIESARKAKHSPVFSVDALINPEDESSGKLIDFMVDMETPLSDVIVGHKELQRDLDMALKKWLTPQEYRIIRWRFGMDDDILTLQEIADKYDLSRERIRQLESRALSKLKRARLAGHADLVK